MKLHGKLLHHYLSCGAPDKEGFLYKKGELNTSYQKRWFTLKGNLLFYRERPSEREVLGVIVLEHSVVQLCESDEHFAFSLSFHGAPEDSGLRTYKFSAKDQVSQESWVKALHSAQHRYLAVLVQDLRQKYLDAARRAGIEPVDLMSSKETLRHFYKFQQSATSSSVFYSTNDNSRDSTRTLQTAPTANKLAYKRSPKLWPKRHAQDPPLPTTEWVEPLDDFIQLHEHFGQEVRRLVAEWRQRRQDREPVLEGDLIDLG